MRKHDAKVILAIIILIAITILIVKRIPESIGISLGSAATSRFIYINTYDYPSMAQQPALVSWSFKEASGNLTTFSGSCNTQVEYFYIPGITQVSAPTSSGIYPNVPLYTYSDGANIALCIISLPANTTSGTMSLSAVGTNGATSGLYSVYLAISPGLPVIITIPLTSSQISSTTTSITTTIPTSSTTIPTSSTTSTSTTSTLTTTSTISQPTAAPQISFSNIIDAIQEAIRNFINSILKILNI